MPETLRGSLAAFPLDIPITFVNLDSAPHTVTSDDGRISSGRLEINNTVTMTFTDPGTVAYYCEFHGSKGGVDMAAKIVVSP